MKTAEYFQRVHTLFTPFTRGLIKSLSILGLFASEHALAELYPVPALCPPDQMTLLIENKNNKASELGLSLGEIDSEEHTLHLGPGTSLVPLRRYTDFYSHINLKSEPNSQWNIRVRCPGKSEKTLREFQNRYYKSSELSQGNYTLTLMNLSASVQNIQILLKNKQGRVLSSITQKLPEQRHVFEISFESVEEQVFFEIKAEGRLATWLHSQQKNGEVPLTTEAEIVTVSQKSHYFLVAAKDETGLPNGESFVLEVSDPAWVPKLREQITQPQLEKILVAGIKKNPLSTNRAWNQKNKTPYSWFVHRIDALADFAHISCDGSPDQIEEKLQQKIEEGGRICFWRYRIVRELSASEVSLGKSLKPLVPVFPRRKL